MSEFGDAPLQAREHTPSHEPAGRPASRPRRPDRWAHRRGEPRFFAFLWATFLLGTTLVSFSILGLRPYATLDTYRPAARVLITVALAGSVLLWPMVRLSQAHPRSARFPEAAARSVGKDLLVVLLPLIAVVAPQAWLAEWPLGVTLALAGAASAWTILAGAVLLIGLETDRRSSAMAALVLLALVCPAVLALAHPHAPAWSWAIWPLTLTHEITRDRPWTGAIASISAAHWRVVGVAWIAGGIAWALAGWACSRTRRRSRSAGVRVEYRHAGATALADGSEHVNGTDHTARKTDARGAAVDPQGQSPGRDAADRRGPRPG